MQGGNEKHTQNFCCKTSRSIGRNRYRRWVVLKCVLKMGTMMQTWFS